ncbi:hypothetical protein SUGI_0021490 [Cryptomeria japonica]|nr:hypothetical protein SUGI_0021490 [Cryptomeria japonica]
MRTIHYRVLQLKMKLFNKEITTNVKLKNNRKSFILDVRKRRHSQAKAWNPSTFITPTVTLKLQMRWQTCFACIVHSYDNRKNIIAMADQDYSKDGIDEAAESFITTFRQDLQIQRLKSLASAKINGKTKERFGESAKLSKRENLDGDIDVDKSAEEFIQKFKRNMKTERIESFKRYNEMLQRGV